MKPILTLLSILFLMLSSIPVVQSAVCAGRNGAVVVRKPARRAVVVTTRRHYSRCRWVRGVRVCR